MGNPKTTLVLGASENEERYSNKAIRELRKRGHPVVAIGFRKGQVLDVPIETVSLSAIQVDTITLYLNPANQVPYYTYLLGLQPRRIIFNPGSENQELENLAQAAGIETLEACTLVMLSTGQYG